MKLKILLVDDEPKVLKGLRTIIERANEEWEIVGECRNGLEALGAIEESCPDVVVTDIKMPSMDGLELVERVKDLQPDLKFIILSGYADFNFAQQAIRLDTVDYILKPPDFKDILNSIRRVEQHKKELEAKHQKEEELTSLKRKVSDLDRERLFHQLLYNPDTGVFSEEMRSGEEYGIFFSRFVLFLIKLDDFSFFIFENTDDKLKKLAHFRDRVQNSVRERGGCLLDLYNGTYCCLLSVKNDSPVYLKGLAREIAAELVQKAEDSFTLGISRAYDEPGRLSTAFKECLIILRNKVFFEKNSIIHIQEVKIDPDTREYPFEVEHKYIESLRFGNREKSLYILKSLVEKAVLSSKQDPVVFKGIIMEFMIAVSKSLSEDDNIDLSGVFSTQGIFNRLNSMDNFNDINQLLMDYTQQVIDYFNSRNSPGCRKIINDIKHYIQNNYFSDITLRQVSNEYFMNESYLSDLFKRETGSSFTSFLTRVRMEKAKALLKQPDLKTPEISEMVGYGNSRYFNKIFKKYCGLTPFEYREKVLNHE